MYEVVIEKQAQKQLVKISPPFYQSIADALRSLSLKPRPHGYKKLKGRPAYRIRVADYRIIYSFQDNILTDYILSIGHRRDVYE